MRRTDGGPGARRVSGPWPARSASSAILAVAAALDGQERRRVSATRCRASSRPSSSGSASGSTISSRSRPPRKGSARPSTRRAAPSATTCRRSAASASCREVRAAYRDPTAASGRSSGRRHAARHALSPVLESDARLSAGAAARGEHHRAPHSDSDVRRRAGRGDPDETLLRARGSRRSQRRRHQRPRRHRRGPRHRRSARRAASAGRRSTRRCGRSAPTPTATRWASPTSCSRRSWRSA